MTRGRKALASGLLALVCPLPLPHVDSYLPLALGVGAAVLAVGRDGPTYLFLMIGVLLVYACVVYGLLSLVEWLRRRDRRDPA
jgi:Ca2+/Na+ antiporter